ncbi:hypothetical protein [Mycolicibacterium aichiense]|uniref:Uncharacterized protein n=1 Tax=Mycolicibacterium aichiense TaxID=1799 RepID=A0AAD1MEB9_9MYCO|nr:hypothetical protein [Mycolicibacterium aichiense]MCV7016738.1 hypothetical protein [Mycolicibacterium aichiense]QFG08054.1 hypothetical protein SEA_HERBERTWM_88 [Mycobacterium phage Herbertwm]BBX09480.1 hypothetical protein MAIC_42830 [Mycolicibacterium aichiense]SUA14045.1 Uncharacterised protein [Mycolicibacterium aichiense]
MSRRLPASDPRVVGGTYFSGYWRMEYVVLEMDTVGDLTWFTVGWQDDRITTHCTAWDPRRDRVISQPSP